MIRYRIRGFRFEHLRFRVGGKGLVRRAHVVAFSEAGVGFRVWSLRFVGRGCRVHGRGFTALGSRVLDPGSGVQRTIPLVSGCLGGVAVTQEFLGAEPLG